jgi:hypothetical protein
MLFINDIMLLLLFPTISCAGVPPSEQGAPSEPAIIEFATGAPSEFANPPWGEDFFMPPHSARQSPKPLAVCLNNPTYNTVRSSFTSCKLLIQRKNGRWQPCTAFFVQPDVMVTAGHCIKVNRNQANPVPLPEYDVTVSNPGYVCCVVIEDPSSDLICTQDKAWSVKAWASTTGWFATERTNDAAVIRVEPYPANQNAPVLQATKASDGQANTPSRSFFSDGYPMEDPRMTGCTLQEFTGRVRREWSIQTSAPLNSPTSQGKDLQYQGSSCGGHSGGRVVDTADSTAYGIVTGADDKCSPGDTSTTYVTQLVDRALPDGAWLNSLVNAIKIGKPNYKWVTPTDSQTSCQAACTAIPGTGWRYINGGSPPSTQPTWALCASVLDLGVPYGQQWVTGKSCDE